MARVYDEEEHRQDALIQWFQANLPELALTVPAESSTSSNDGEGKVWVMSAGSSNELYVITVELTNEACAAGDPSSMQLMRYFQVRM